MKIDFENVHLQSKIVFFNGETEDGKEFTITANWNDWEEWSVEPDNIAFSNDDGTEEDCEKIIEEFLSEMND
jgi:hypothetical protein